MLIDIFARRYGAVQLRDSFEKRDSRLLVQAFRILSEDFYPYYISGKEDPPAVIFWASLHNRLSRELGVRELSPLYFFNTATWNGKETRQAHKWTMDKVCENWLILPVTGSPDEHIKERLSLIELGFRDRESMVNTMNAQPISSPDNDTLPSIDRLPTPRNLGEHMRQFREQTTARFRASVVELNARFQQAGYPLHYHNGFIQAATDQLVQSNIEEPFWNLLSAPQWENVDTDMKEALDRRDGGGRDPELYAARALESTIKIISDMKGWTTGKEKGAHNFIENLGSKKRAFVAPWESASLKEFFTNVRNPIGHGAGSAKMPSLTAPQTEWAIEFSMSWIKSLIRRL